MITPFDDVIADIKKRGFHNHRLEDHSDIVGEGILRDLLKRCKTINKDFEEGRIKYWLNVHTPGARHRKIDLLIGESKQGIDAPDLDFLAVSQNRCGLRLPFHEFLYSSCASLLSVILQHFPAKAAL